MLCCCRLLYREPGNNYGVLLYTTAQGAREYLRWFYDQRTHLVCIPDMIQLRLQPGDELLPIGIK